MKIKILIVLTIVFFYSFEGCKKEKIVNNDEGIVTDVDGNKYKTIKIGNQTWMAENLKVIHYPNGDTIPHVVDKYEWRNLESNDNDDAYCYYDNLTSNMQIYGVLYTYAAAIGDNWTRDNNKNQGVCPDGWHLPNDAEFTILNDYLGGLNVAGGKLKEKDTTHWESPNIGATNSSNFSALPGGSRDYQDGSFGIGDGGYYGGWWIATNDNDNEPECAWLRYMYWNTEEVYKSYGNKSNGFSVRCLKD